MVMIVVATLVAAVGVGNELEEAALEREAAVGGLHHVQVGEKVRGADLGLEEQVILELLLTRHGVVADAGSVRRLLEERQLPLDDRVGDVHGLGSGNAEALDGDAAGLQLLLGGKRSRAR